MKPPTKEIEFFCHPDQAWLQEEWEPAVGDWYCISMQDSSDVIDEYDKPYPLEWRTFVLASEEEVSTISSYRHGGVWLPTLSDLLGMIEEALEKLPCNPNMPEFRRRYTITRDRGHGGYTISLFHDPSIKASSGWLTIAAAKLLKKIRNEET